MSKQYVLQQLLFSVLNDGQHELIFKKADDTHRVMRATRDPILIEVSERGSNAFKPADSQKVEKKERKESNVLNVVVYDIDAKDWRSFRIDRLVSINGTGIGTLAGLINSRQEYLNMGFTYDRYVEVAPKAVYFDVYAQGKSYIDDLVENASRFELISDKYGVKTWLVDEAANEF